LFLLLVPQLYTPGHLVEGLAVVQLQLRPPAEKVLQLRDERDLRLHPDVEASQLLVQLQPYICNNDSLSLEIAKGSIATRILLDESSERGISSQSLRDPLGDLQVASMTMGEADAARNNNAGDQGRRKL